jgi:transcriptional regulator with XRE-family HTH domain
LLAELKALRVEAGLTQGDLARLLKRSQSYVGKCELGERRMDVVQLRDFCNALDTPLLKFMQRYEDALKSQGLD